MEKELWKTIKNFPNYQISNLGRLKYLARKFERVNPKYPKYNQVIKIKEKINRGWIKYSKNKRPCCVMVSLRKNNKVYEYRMHRLVLEGFIGPCPPNFEGCHNDGNPLNNKLSNLRWDSHLNNCEDSFIHGTKTKPPVHRGEEHPKTKLKSQDIIDIRSYSGYRGLLSDLSKKYEVSIQTIKRIRERTVWNHI